MKIKFRVLSTCMVFIFVTAFGSCASNANQEAVNEAVDAAVSWLEMIDAGEYGKSWEHSAELFKASLSMEKWEQALGAVRKPLGGLKERKVKSTKYATSLPGAPDGEYVVIQFATSFTNKKSSIETVTPMKDPDGVWRVSGYYIQ